MSEAPPKPAKPIKPTKKSSALDLIDDKKIVTSEEHYLAKQAFVAELTLFYKDHCPEKISGVEHAASVVYKHDELSLVHDLCKKYKVEPEAAPAPGSGVVLPPSSCSLSLLISSAFDMLPPSLPATAPPAFAASAASLAALLLADRTSPGDLPEPLPLPPLILLLL